MADKEIEVQLAKDVIVVLTTDSPDLEKFIKRIVEEREKIEPDNIKVSSNEKFFDTESFREVIANTIKKFKDEIELERKKFDAAVAEINQNE